MSHSKLNALAPLTGLMGIGGVLAGLFLDNFPDGTMDDAAVAHWFDVHGTTRWIVSGAMISLGGTLLLVFAAVVATRAEDAGASPVLTRLTQTAATGWAMLTMVGGALWLGPPISVEFFDVRPSESLMAGSGMAYGVLVSVCAFAAAVLAAALTAISRQTGLLPRWVTMAGYPAAALMLTNVLLPMAVITLWFGTVTIALARRARSTTQAQPQGAPVPA